VQKSHRKFELVKFLVIQRKVEIKPIGRETKRICFKEVKLLRKNIFSFVEILKRRIKGSKFSKGKLRSRKSC
jgi:hypothetical protein